ncbi:MAG: L-histidine N(alpha)-methyltransferase [Ilumatobacteraceae bacterium]
MASGGRASRHRRLRIADVLPPGDWLLVGLDLIKQIDRIIDADADRGGATDAFIHNALRAFNRDLDAEA